MDDNSEISHHTSAKSFVSDVIIVKHSIQWKLISRLIVVWLILSMIFGALIIYLETEQVDRTVVTLAYNQSEAFVEANKDQLLGNKPVEIEVLNQESLTLIQENFILVEIYNKDQTKIFETRTDFFSGSHKTLDQEQHQFPSDNQATYTKFFQNKILYLQVIVPMLDENNKPYAYFEGIYQVDPQTTSNIRSRVLWSLGQTVTVIFITTLILYPIILVLNKEILRSSKRLLNTNIELLDILSRVTEKRDHETNLHSYRVTIYAVALAEKIGLSPDVIRPLIKGAFLHDLGKVAINDDILLKPGKLTPDEFEIMKTHVDHGVDIAKQSEWLQDALDVIQYHHEKFDGSGYMQGLKGAEIPITAQIFAIADVFDALTSQRPYKEAFTLQHSLTILNEGKGTHFAPELVEAFMQIAVTQYQDFTLKEGKNTHSVLNAIIKKYF